MLCVCGRFIYLQKRLTGGYRKFSPYQLLLAFKRFISGGSWDIKNYFRSSSTEKNVWETLTDATISLSNDTSSATEVVYIALIAIQ